MKCRHPSPSFENITRPMVWAVKCDSRSECLGGLDEEDCNTDLVTYVAGEFCYYKHSKNYRYNGFLRNRETNFIVSIVMFILRHNLP